jgi:hypothetical protein
MYIFYSVSTTIILNLLSKHLRETETFLQKQMYKTENEWSKEENFLKS